MEYMRQKIMAELREIGGSSEVLVCGDELFLSIMEVFVKDIPREHTTTMGENSYCVVVKKQRDPQFYELFNTFSDIAMECYLNAGWQLNVDNQIFLFKSGKAWGFMAIRDLCGVLNFFSIEDGDEHIFFKNLMKAYQTVKTISPSKEKFEEALNCLKDGEQVSLTSQGIHQAVAYSRPEIRDDIKNLKKAVDDIFKEDVND